MASEVMDGEDRIVGLESQVLSSQESMARLSRELDSALLRIATLENVCSENQDDLHKKRIRMKELDDEISEREEVNERLIQELNEKDEKLNQFNELISQLKEHIKQKAEEEISRLEQHEFDRQLRELILEFQPSSYSSPQDLLDQYRQHEREQFRDLLQKSLISDNLSHQLDSNDILFELFTDLNSLQRSKDILSRDSQQLQDIRSLLHLPDENPDQFIHDLLKKRECMEYLRSKIENNSQWTDFDLIEHVLHDYLHFREQQMELKDYLQLKETDDRYTRILIDRYEEKMHMTEELNERIQVHEQFRTRFHEIISEFVDQEMNVDSQLDRLRAILQSKIEQEQQQPIIDELTKQIERFKEERHNQLKEMTDSFGVNNDDEESQLNLIRSSITFHRTLLNKFSPLDNTDSILQQIDDLQKQDVEIQTTGNDQLLLQIKELIGMEEDRPEEMINKLQELLETSRIKIDENEKVRSLLNLDDEDLFSSIMHLNENYQRLSNEHETLLQSITRMTDQIGVSSDSSSQTQIEEICHMFNTFRLEYCQLTSRDLESMNLMKIFKQIELFHIEHKQLQTLINRIDFDQIGESSDDIWKFQTYLTKVESLCRLIGNDNTNIDQALIMYRTKMEEDGDVVERIADFKQQLLQRLAIENEEQIFDLLEEIQQNNIDLTSTVTSLNTTVAEQRSQILEHEETAEKLRLQRERMLNKLKDMKSNNESLTTELQLVHQSIDVFRRKEIDSQNHLEEVEQQLRTATSQIQVTQDDCRTQEDLQETMKLEIDSLKNEIQTQRKLYENRCRQILNEKKQLDKSTKESSDEKQLLEEENKQLQILLQTIQDSLENVEDIHSIVYAIHKLDQDRLVHQQHNEQLRNENEKLLFHIEQQGSTMIESIQTKTNLEKRLIDHEEQSRKFQEDIDKHLEQYRTLQNEFYLYKEDHPTKTNLQVATINIEQSSPPVQPHLLAVQQATETNHWMAIDMKDEEIPLHTTSKHSSIDMPTALLNLLGELKSKLGITLTHRPRSSSAFFLYLCAVHLLTVYLLFLRRC